MNIYLVRHGESELNKVSVHQTEDTPLSPEGIKQANKLAERIKKLKIDFIYSSPYKRAKQTAEIISKKLKKPIEYCGGALHEMKNPSEILQLHYDHDESKRIRALIKENFDKRNWRYSEEETFEDLVERSKNILDHLLNNHLEQNVLCISHGTIIKMIVSRDVFGEKLTSSVFWEFRHHTWQANTGLTHLEHTEKHGWVLISWNDTTHL